MPFIKDTTRGLTAQRLRGLLSYDSDTGEFRWLLYHGSRACAGMIAGSLSPRGYRRIKLMGHQYGAHRLAWLHVHGRWPADQIDHINGDRADNCIANLREATHIENLRHRGGAPRNSKTGARCVWATGNRFRAHVRINGHKSYLGYFDTIGEADAAAVAARKHVYGEFAGIKKKENQA